MSAPVPSPSMNGRMGRSGTSRRPPAATRICSPGGTVTIENWGIGPQNKKTPGGASRRGNAASARLLDDPEPAAVLVHLRRRLEGREAVRHVDRAHAGVPRPPLVEGAPHTPLSARIEARGELARVVEEEEPTRVEGRAPPVELGERVRVAVRRVEEHEVHRPT